MRTTRTHQPRMKEGTKAMTNDRNDKARSSKTAPAEKRGRNKAEAGSPKTNAPDDRTSHKGKQRDLDPAEGPFVDDADMDTPTSTSSR